MKLAHFVEQGAVVGGVERYLADLLAADPAGFDHHVVLGQGDRCDFAGRWPVTKLPWSAEGRSRPPAEAELTRALGALDAVCLMHYPPSPGTLVAAQRAGVPVAVFCHDHRWWCASGSRYHRRLNRICTIRGSTSACALRYHALRCGGLRPGPLVRGFARATAGRQALARAGAILTASRFMAAEAALHGAAVAHTHVAPLPTAFAGQVLPAPPAGSATTVLFASRLTPEKGVATLLEAFALMRGAIALELAGTGISAAATARTVAAHPRADRIRLLGHLENREMRDAYARASVVVVPSLWPEPFGLVGVEALAAGRPVVTTGVGGTAEWARADLGVLVTPPGRPAELAAALDRVVADPTWEERAREAGSRWVREHHSASAHVARLREVLAPLAAGRGTA